MAKSKRRKEEISYDDLVQDLEDKYGIELFSVAEKINGVVPTGSISLDLGIGIGGFPKGRISEIFGQKSTGKTTIAISALGSELRRGNRCAFIDMERTTTIEYIHTIVGQFDESLLMFLSPETAEDAFEICETLIKSGLFSLIVFDSLGAQVLEAVQDMELKDNARVAGLANLLTKWIARVTRPIKENDVAFLFIGQVRANIGSYSKKPITPGGNALEHVLSVRVFLSHSKRLELGDDVVGQETYFQVDKNKVSSPHRQGSIPLVYGKGIDYHRDVLNFATEMGIIKKAGSYFKFEEETLGQGFVLATEFLANPENKETLDKIVKMCYNIYLDTENLIEGEGE